MKKFILYMFFCISACCCFGQKINLKTNLLHDISTTLNIGTEFRMAARWTADVSIDYNPWSFNGEKFKMKRLSFTPEARYWLCKAFEGHFILMNAGSGIFNARGLHFVGKEAGYRYQGYYAGAGIGYGYQWILSDRFSLEAAAGLGYMHGWYDKYSCNGCSGKVESGLKGGKLFPTKLAVSVIYFLK